MLTGRCEKASISPERLVLAAIGWHPFANEQPIMPSPGRQAGDRDFLDETASRRSGASDDTSGRKRLSRRDVAGSHG
jgi:hypothetical protein